MVKYQVIEVKDKENCKYIYYVGGYLNSISIYITNEITIPPDRNVDYIFLIYDVKEIMAKVKMIIEEYKKQNKEYEEYILEAWFMFFSSYKHKKYVYDTTRKIIYFKNIDEDFVNFYSNVINSVEFYFNQKYDPEDEKLPIQICDFGYSFTRIINDFKISENVKSLTINKYNFTFNFVYNSKQGFFLTNQINPMIEQFYKTMIEKNNKSKNNLLLYSFLIKDET